MISLVLHGLAESVSVIFSVEWKKKKSWGVYLGLTALAVSLILRTYEQHRLQTWKDGAEQFVSVITEAEQKVYYERVRLRKKNINVFELNIEKIDLVGPTAVGGTK